MINHSVCKRTLNHLTKLTKWLSCVVSTYLYCAFEFYKTFNNNFFKEHLRWLLLIWLGLKNEFSRSQLALFLKVSGSKFKRFLITRTTFAYLFQMETLFDLQVEAIYNTKPQSLKNTYLSPHCVIGFGKFFCQWPYLLCVQGYMHSN